MLITGAIGVKKLCRSPALHGKLREDPNRIEDPDRSVRSVGAMMQLCDYEVML